MANDLSRRDFLRYLSLSAAGAVALGSSGLLSACSSSDSKPKPQLGTLSLQTNWLMDGSWAPLYLAKDRKWYENVGFSDFNLISRAATDTTPDLFLGGAHMSFTGVEAFSAAVMAGAPVKCVAAWFQKNPFCITSLQNKAIRTPKDLVGKTIGVQNYNLPMWNAFLKSSGIDPASLKTIDSGNPEDLTGGKVDGQMTFVVYGPPILRLQNVQHVVMMLADHDFTLYQAIIVVSDQELEEHRDRALATFRLLMYSLQETIEDTQAAIDLIPKYATEGSKDTAFWRQAWLESIDLARSPVTEEHGLGYLDPHDVELSVKTLGLAGLQVPVNAFSTTLLDELYADGTKLTI